MVLCMLGDLEQVHKAYGDFKTEQKLETVMFAGIVMSCVSMASHEGHETIVRYLIREEIDQRYLTPSKVARQMYEKVLREATGFRQLRCLPFLLVLVDIGQDLDPDRDPESIAALPILKGVLLRDACEHNNVGFVQFLLESGDIRLYSRCSWGNRPVGNPIRAATEVGVNAECIRLVLRSQHRFTHTPEQQEALIEDEWPPILETGRFELFLEILPYLQQPLLDGALIDGGVEAAVRLRGPFDYSLPIRNAWPGKSEEFYSGKETMLGAEALSIAARRHAIENVDFLLNQKVTTSKKICLPPPGEKDMAVHNKLKDLLTNAKLLAMPSDQSCDDPTCQGNHGA